MKLPFWFSPVVMMLLWWAIGLISLMLPDSVYWDLMKAPKLFEPVHFAYLSFALLNFSLWTAIGILTARSFSPYRPEALKVLTYAIEKKSLKRYLIAFSAIVAFSYAIWFLPTLNSSVISTILSGGNATFARDIGNQISGVTTMTQFAVPVAVISSYGLFLTNNESTRKFYRRIIVALCILGAYRAVIWSERLGLLEIIVPIGVTWVICRFRGQLSITVLPIAGVIGVISIFGITEYFRSWAFYGQFEQNIAVFSALRFLSYYISSFNNMGMSIEFIEPTYQPMHTLQMLFKLPIPFLEGLNQMQNELWAIELKGSLARFSNPEFNLFGGVGLAINDFGITGGILVLGIHGFLSGLIYGLLRRGSIVGLVFYPCWIVGLLEFGRLLYWGNGRALPIWVLAFIFVVILRRLDRLKRERIVEMPGTLKI